MCFGCGKRSCSHGEDKTEVIETTENGRPIKFSRKTCAVCGIFLGDENILESA